MSRASWMVSLLVGFTAATAPTQGNAFVPTSLTFFGDSLTDSGNGDLILASLFLPDLTPTPPYAEGVASDGPVWAQYLAGSLARGGDAAPSRPPYNARNFAIGTARTGRPGASGFPVGMLAQFDSYGASGLATDPTGLYTLYGGANDIFDAAAKPTATQSDQTLVAAVDNLAVLAQDLYGLGARHFLMPNTFDVGRAPAAISDPQRYGELSRRFNELLAGKLTELESTLPDSTFYALSLDVLEMNVAFDAAQGGVRYGFTNLAQPCLAPGAPACSISVFADDRHPTTAFHALIAQAAYDRVVLGIDVTPVPEPEIAVMFLAGIGLLSVLRRRTGLGT